LICEECSMKYISRLLLFFLLFSVVIPWWSSRPADARQLPMDPSQIERIRILGPNNVPIKVLVVCNSNSNLDFAVGLIKIVAQINESDRLSPQEKLKVHVVLARPSDREILASHVPTLMMKEFVEINDKLFTGDQWMQDWGEVMTVRMKGDPKQHIAVLDSNRGREIAKLPGILANFWNCYYLKNPSNAFSAGDYGGNVEITPDDVLIIGNTSTKEFRDFLADHGYRNRMVVVETDWLQVGHCDEYLSIIPNPKVAEGFTMVKANPRLALRLIKDSPRKDLEKIEVPEYKKKILEVHDYLNSAAGAEAVSGRQAADSNPGGIFRDRVVRYLDSLDKDGIPGRKTQPLMDIASDRDVRDPAMIGAERFVRKNLALAVIIDSNIQKIFSKINEVNKTLGAGHSLISFPVLYKMVSGNSIAFVPGVVNQLILRKHLIIPDPKVKAFSDFISHVTTKVGLVPHFLDDMNYHTLLGEIHCGTNVFRHPNRYVVKPKNLPADLAPLH